jgi:aryl-alcohol dehydrogenase-like predicted oxidoreductase
MNMRTLGVEGPQLTVIGFGAWAIGGPWIYGWGPQDDKESTRTIHRALDRGINWIDTAAAYGFGHSEEVVGSALKGMRHNVFVATKCGLVPDGTGGAYRNSKPGGIRQELEDSLRRLQTEYVDLYQIHWPDASVPYEDSWETMLRVKEEGKARFVGVCNYEVPMMETCRALGSVQSLQPPYSMLTRDIERDILPYCLENQLGVVAYSPMQSGLLTGRFDITRLAADDWRRNYFWFQEPHLSSALRLVDELRPIAAARHQTVGQLAVQWVLHHPAVTSAIVGARTPAQVDENVAAGEGGLTDEEYRHITSIVERHFPAFAAEQEES